MTQSIADRCRTRADEAETAAKTHTCRANAEMRVGLEKAAAVFRMVAGWADEGMDNTTIAATCRAKAADYMHSAKAYRHDVTRAGYVKGAATLTEIAVWAEGAGSLSDEQAARLRSLYAQQSQMLVEQNRANAETLATQQAEIAAALAAKPRRRRRHEPEEQEGSEAEDAQGAHDPE